MFTDRKLVKEYTLKRLQRAAEYSLLTAINVFFLLGFWGMYQWWTVATMGLLMFCMNFQLTQLRERRRLAPKQDRKRLIADTVESLLFLVLILLFSFSGALLTWMELSQAEYYGYLAAVLGGIFTAGLAGELYFQIRYIHTLETDQLENYVHNLKRTIILPYLSSRVRNK